MAESRAANSSNSPDAPRPLPARPRPAPGQAVELGDVESDEAMATRLHREEQTRINARTRDAFYPNQPFDPSPRSTSQAHRDAVVRHADASWSHDEPDIPSPSPAHEPDVPVRPDAARHHAGSAHDERRDRAQHRHTARDVDRAHSPPTQRYTDATDDRDDQCSDAAVAVLPGDTHRRYQLWVGVTACTITGRDAITHVDDDEAFARALQAQEEEAGGRGAYGRSVSAVDEGDAALAARLQAEEDAGSRLSAGPSSRPPETDDEALARALQEEEDRAGRGGPPSRSAPTGPDPGPSGPFRAPPGACPGCLRAPSVFEGHITAMGSKWHRGCFKCGSCSKPIGESHFAVREGTPYHRGCYQDRFAPKCGVCCQFIGETGGRRGIAGGSVRFMTHPYWGTVFCPEHELDGTRRCDGCDRMEARGGRGVAAGGYGSIGR